MPLVLFFFGISVLNSPLFSLPAFFVIFFIVGIWNFFRLFAVSEIFSGKEGDLLEMESCGDFMGSLGYDMSVNVLTRLDDPADLVRASCVSRSWRQFVVENGLCKKMCLEMFPELVSFTEVIELSNPMGATEVGSCNCVEQDDQEKEHRVYTRLARGLKSAKKRDCIQESICASSTDNDPDESIDNTLDSSDIVGRRPSYWSSKGQRDPEVPETLTYKLCSKLCIVDEVNIQPFKAFFQYGHPIYSAKAVRFKMGSSKSPLETMGNLMDKIVTCQKSCDDPYIWTYVSPKFPMVQDNCLQTFKLPQPVLCMGGILQIELLGRVQKQDMDDLYYICVSHVQVVGRPLSPAFDVELTSFPGRCVLKCSSGAEEDFNSLENASADESAADGSGGWLAFAARIRQRGQQRAATVWNRARLLNALLGNVAPENNQGDG